ncbi:MAG: hypothetical protein AB8H79_18580 [Myxococcota bacterium]
MLLSVLLLAFGLDSAAAADHTVRIVVLDTGEVDEGSAAFQRTLKAMLPEEELLFVSDVDLYQGGRVRAGTAAANQVGSVPDSIVSKFKYNAEDIATVGIENMTTRDWKAYSEDLAVVLDEAWFIDRPELRAPLMNLSYQTGRAGENGSAMGPPWEQEIDGMTLNSYYFRAAAMVDGDESLLEEVADDTQRETLQGYVAYLNTGRVNRAEIPLDLDDKWDVDEFFETYTLVVDGLEIDPDALGGKQRASLRRDGVLEIAPGTRDVFFRRKDGGVGLSTRLVVYSPDDPVEPLREKARSEVAAKLIKAFADGADTCIVSPPDEVLPHLAVYGALHEEPVYIAMADKDDPNKPLLFKWDGKQSSLAVIDAGAEPFPVRFAGIIGTGMAVNGATYEAPSFTGTDFQEPDIGIGIGYLPFFARLRGHYQHLMVLVGGEVQLPVAGIFTDRYQTAEGQKVVDGNGVEALKEPPFGTQVYIGGGYMHGLRAADGFGVHVSGRVGVHNVPNVIDVAVHGGLTTEGPVPGQGRLASLIDVEGYLGVLVPYGDTVLRKPLLNLGFTAGVGTTF